MSESGKLRKRSRRALLDLKPYLDEINQQVEKSDYIEKDPVQFLHAFSDKKDIEIAGFFAATMAWGRRDTVIRKVEDLMKRFRYAPFQYIMNYDQSAFSDLNRFKHRTFKPVDIHGLILGLQNIYKDYGDFETFWEHCYHLGNIQKRPFLAIFHHLFFEMSPDAHLRSRKHISNPEKGSTCKRLYMYLRWMIRKNSPVDVGIWNFLSPAELLIPFDVHVARQARIYGLISRKSNDWKTVQELTNTLRILNPEDPAIYDYALFGLGALHHTLPSHFVLNRRETFN